MPKMFRPLTALVLAMSIMAMGLLAASARGQILAGGQVLALCSAGGLVQATVDAEGRPTGERHLCPDLAPGLLAALGVSAPEVVTALMVLAADMPGSGAASSAGLPGAAPKARAPPVPV